MLKIFSKILHSIYLQYELRVTASDSFKENYTTVVINVRDVNDNSVSIEALISELKFWKKWTEWPDLAELFFLFDFILRKHPFCFFKYFHNFLSCFFFSKFSQPIFEKTSYRTQITEEDDRALPKRVLKVSLTLTLPSGQKWHFSTR